MLSQREPMAITRTLARKLDVVHRTTVTSRRMIPSVRRAKPPSVGALFFWTLAKDLKEDEEVLGGRLRVSSPSRTGMVKSAAAAGGA